MGSSRPPPRTPEIFPAPPALSLSLSLAGPFGRNEPAVARGDEVDDGDEGGGGIRLRGGGLRPREAMEISSENMGQGSQSGGAWSGEEADGQEDAGGNKKRKNCYRHTTEQIRVLEAAFQESSHPHETQRRQLSEQLGLSPSQVKFWFQNRRFQAKVTQERHENLLLKPQLEKLQEQNRAMRELIKKSPHCPTRGAAAAPAMDTEEQLLRQENAKLKAEVQRLRRALGSTAAVFRTSPSCSSRGGIQIRSRNSLGDYADVGHDTDKTRFLKLAGRALDELTAMCSSGQPLWVRSAETGRDVLNYDEYARLFRRYGDDSGDRRAVWSVEASRETAVVYIEATKLVGAFVDVNQWKEMFPSMITKASTLEVICAGENDHRDGVVQLMFAEVQTLTPLVPTRELYFLRHSKKLGTNKWAIVDVSLDNLEPGAQAAASSSSMTTPLCMFFKKPSGCIVEEHSCGYCKVTWVEHAKFRKAAAPVPSMYRTVAASGLAFGARRWVAALRLQCERMVFSVATNVPTRGSNGVATLAGRQSVLKLAQRMTSSLCRAIDASRSLALSRAWNANRGGTRGIQVASRTSTGGEPRGLISCAVLSAWLPVSPAALFGFLLDESRRHEWDLLLPGRSAQSYVTVRKGDDRGNCVTAYAAKSSGEDPRRLSGKWVLQDSSTGPCESTVAYAPVDAAVLWPVICGRDSSAVAVLPCGFVVMPDEVEAMARPAVITSRKAKEKEGEGEDRAAAAESAGSLVTLVFQALVSSSATGDDALPTDAVDAVRRLASCTLGNIKKALRCGDR